jgi:CDP-diacylglycerol---serine O-phosphatidyltransferase
MKRHIPNSITLLNLFSGCLGIMVLFRVGPAEAAWFIAAAAIFDFFDGFVARKMGVVTPAGKELDALADIVSFGVLPGFIMYSLLEKSAGLPETAILGFAVMPFAGLLIPVFSALRLARFNVTKENSGFFSGIPTPANALLIASFSLLVAGYGKSMMGLHGVLFHWLSDGRIVLALCVLLSILLVSKVKCFSLKFADGTWGANKARNIFLIISLILFVYGDITSVPLIFAIYITLSLIFPPETRVSAVKGV